MEDKKTKEEILKTPINQLGLNVLESDLSAPLKQLHQELDAAQIQFHPEIYFSDSWGCPDGVPIIGAPFYLANKTLKEIETEKNGPVESDEEIMQTLRHEAGHAFNYAHSLYKLKRWNDIFGAYEKPYEENFAAIPGNKKFVRHLEGWYAQKHPDEDFSETFALLITPGFDWKKYYQGTRAFKKLAFAAELIKEYGSKPVPEFEKKLETPVESITTTIEEWYKKIASAQTKSKIKILILFYQEYPSKKPKRDAVIDQIKDALLNLNYNVVLLPANQSIARIINGIKQEKPDLIFNLIETFRNTDKFEFNITALLEMTKIPFTGSASGSIFLTNDKLITKKILSFNKIPYPDFFVIPLGEDPVRPKNLDFPLFVKPVHEDASIGIDDNSVVESEEAFIKKVNDIHENIKDDALVEKYIEGREFFVSILSSGKTLKPLQLLELDFSKWPANKHKIYTHEAKLEEEMGLPKTIGLKIPNDLPNELKDKIYDIAIKANYALGARDYARFDMRMDKDNKIYVLEANLNPYLEQHDEMAIAAEASGLNHQQLIDKIVEAALIRSGIIK
ncbi:MAG TPA: ATP-grasp domain-containing protein [Candidatus Paceibacterota bacterium]|nr:ATP-grasp domain-containing protein [Candidatus Paceibacterota bacterium]HPT40589.1 ATP-grasp domain-containing protein [Candidatus Paceibacterota bacterium]